MDPTNQALNLWATQPLVLERKPALDNALELAQIETAWVQVMNDRYNLRNGNAPPVPELEVMIEHWTLQLARTQDLKDRGLFLDDTLYSFFMGAFALNKSNAEKVKVAAEENDEKQRALERAQEEVQRAQAEVQRTQHVLKWERSNNEYNLARLERRVTEMKAAEQFWTEYEAQAYAEWHAEDPEGAQAWADFQAANPQLVEWLVAQCRESEA